MIRVLTIVGVVVALSAAAGLYRVKMRTAELGDQVRALGREIDREEEAIAVLRAEWSLLNQPDRLQALAERYLDLDPMSIDQIVRVDGLSDFLANAGAADDHAPATVSSTR